MGRKTVALIVASWVIPISLLVNHIVPDPYMDEIFHIPQAQQYCRANFRSWDPMITTPPGLYYLSLAHVTSLFPGMLLLRQYSSFSDLCTTANLRSINGALAVVCSVLVYEIITQLRPALDKRKATMFSVVLALYPLHWFFTYLYYTDVASLTVFLAMYLGSLKKKYFFSALLGAFAIFIRQTNVIWMLFVACSSVLKILLVHPRQSDVQNSGMSSPEKDPITTKYDRLVNQGLRKRKTAVEDSIPMLPSSKKVAISSVYLSGLVDELQCMLIRAWHLKWELIISFIPFLLVLVSFAAFVYWNGSVVLGAKEAHAVSFHFAQILYFALVSTLLSAPFHLTLNRGIGLLGTLWKSRPISFVLVIGAVAGGLLFVHYFSIAHPYLLADNRHYPFYLWRKVINAHWLMRYFLVPVYVYSWLSILELLGKSQSKVWVLAYFLASVAVLVPTPLVEFRYYTIPFFIFMLNCAVDDTSKWLLMAILNIGINVFTLYMFLYRPFQWTHEPGIQRFIW